jgi:diphosphomevalonate decarboxylase
MPYNRAPGIIGTLAQSIFNGSGMTQVIAEARPNIALVKYWGKRDIGRNLPAVDSLSVTLQSLHTRMTVRFDAGVVADALQVNGVTAAAMLPRVSACLDRVCGTDRPRAFIVSESNFPIGAGLASSASAFAALVVAAARAAGQQRDTIELARLAGEASGSAARSLYGGIVALRVGEAEIELQQLAGPDEWPLEVVVALTAEGSKSVGSGDAMIRSAKTSPFYAGWVERQDADFKLARDAVNNKDFAKLATVAEHNCLKMHSLMWTSRPPIVYWNKATLACMETVRELQNSGEPVFFTIDAGPQVKAICLPQAAQCVRDALEQTDGVLRTMQSSLGAGANVMESP